jgi:hypothetical protein
MGSLKRTRIPIRIRKLADLFGLEIRVGREPKSVSIPAKIPKDAMAAYFRNGLIFVRDKTRYNQADMNIVILHEIGHAILDFFPLDITNNVNEIKANAIALSLAVVLNIPVSQLMIDNFNAYAKLVEGDKK